LDFKYTDVTELIIKAFYTVYNLIVAVVTDWSSEPRHNLGKKSCCFCK